MADDDLLRTVANNGGMYSFTRRETVLTDADFEDFDRFVERVHHLADRGFFSVVGTPLRDYTGPGDHYVGITVRLTPKGQNAIKPPTPGV